MRRPRVPAALLLMAVLLMAAPGVATAQSLENSVKANYLARFAAFIQWPPGSGPTGNGPLVICVI